MNPALYAHMNNKRKMKKKLKKKKRKTLHKNRLVEWLKVKTLSSSPSTAKKNPYARLECTSVGRTLA
jgi:hypothetical protein